MNAHALAEILLKFEPTEEIAVLWFSREDFWIDDDEDCPTHDNWNRAVTHSKFKMADELMSEELWEQLNNLC